MRARLSFLRGGVLEPEGTVEIKYRLKDILKTIHRCDPECLALLEKLQRAESEKKREEIGKLLKKREDTIVPIYHTVAVQFAALHDTSGRMLEKGVINVSGGPPKISMYRVSQNYFLFIDGSYSATIRARNAYYSMRKMYPLAVAGSCIRCECTCQRCTSPCM